MKLPTWKQVQTTFWLSRWCIPSINILLGALCIGWGATQNVGWWRDYFMILGGGQIGLAVMWFVTPYRVIHMSEEQKKAMSDDVALIMIQAARRAEETYGIPFQVEPPPTSRMN